MCVYSYKRYCLPDFSHSPFVFAHRKSSDFHVIILYSVTLLKMFPDGIFRVTYIILSTVVKSPLTPSFPVCIPLFSFIYIIF